MSDGSGAPPRARSDESLRIRGRRPFAEGPVKLHLALVQRRRELERKESYRDPSRTSSCGVASSDSKRVQCRCSAADRYQPFRGRPETLRLLLGYGRESAI